MNLNTSILSTQGYFQIEFLKHGKRKNYFEIKHFKKCFFLNQIKQKNQSFD